MDQAAKLRELTNKRNILSADKKRFVTVLSGKGGVGKTTLVTDLYGLLGNVYIVDCDISSPYFWLHSKDFNCCEGFDTMNGKKMVKEVDKNELIAKYKYLIVDAGTGMNEINKYFIGKSRVAIFVSSMEQISVLNTINLMKKVDVKKIVYMPNVDLDVIKDMQDRVVRYSKLYLDGSDILVTNDVNDIVGII